MSLPKVLSIIALLVFVIIGVASLTKKSHLFQKDTPIADEPIFATEIPLQNQELAKQDEPEQKPVPPVPVVSQAQDETDNIDRIQEFFNLKPPQLPIIETITYKSRVAWLKGRPAWVADYASHYKTSRHFIARSLNGKPDYEKQDVSEGDKFNVFRQDIDFNFLLVVDINTCKMKFYYVDKDKGEKVLIKTYQVGLGRPDENVESKFLTPIGTYKLGDKVAIYKPKQLSFYQGSKVEMIRIFGTRWIPFVETDGYASAPSQGLGIHGVPWNPNDQGVLEEDRNGVGLHMSDGCIRLATGDMEELFAVIISRPAYIELVKN